MKNTEIRHIDLPDRTISIKEVNDYGYDWEGMLPLRDRMAFYLFNTTQIYLLYPDGSEAAADDLSELNDHANDGGIFGIEVDSWQKSCYRV